MNELLARSRKDGLYVASKDLPPQFDRSLFRPVASDHKIFEEHFGENPAIHLELRPAKLQFVHVTVVANVLIARNGFQTAAAIRFNERRNVRIPPVSIRNHVRKDPRIAHQFHIARMRQYRDRELDSREGIEQAAVLIQRDPLIEQVLPLIDTGFIDSPVNPDHEVKWQVVL